MKFARPKVGRPSFGRPSFGPVRAALARVPRPGARFEKIAWFPAGVAIAAAVVLVSVFSDTVQSTDSTLVLMGFDPDRAQLITALIIGGTAAAAVTLVVNRIGFATMLGALSIFALFAETFVFETQNAVGSTGLTGMGRSFGGQRHLVGASFAVEANGGRAWYARNTAPTPSSGSSSVGRASAFQVRSC